MEETRGNEEIKRIKDILLQSYSEQEINQLKERELKCLFDLYRFGIEKKEVLRYIKIGFNDKKVKALLLAYTELTDEDDIKGLEEFITSPLGGIDGICETMINSIKQGLNIDDIREIVKKFKLEGKNITPYDIVLYRNKKLQEMKVQKNNNNIFDEEHMEDLLNEIQSKHLGIKEEINKFTTLYNEAKEQLEQTQKSYKDTKESDLETEKKESQEVLESTPGTSDNEVLKQLVESNKQMFKLLETLPTQKEEKKTFSSLFSKIQKKDTKQEDIDNNTPEINKNDIIKKMMEKKFEADQIEQIKNAIKIGLPIDTINSFIEDNLSASQIKKLIEIVTVPQKDE